MLVTGKEFKPGRFAGISQFRQFRMGIAVIFMWQPGVIIGRRRNDMAVIRRIDLQAGLRELLQAPPGKGRPPLLLITGGQRHGFQHLLVFPVIQHGAVKKHRGCIDGQVFHIAC